MAGRPGHRGATVFSRGGAGTRSQVTAGRVPNLTRQPRQVPADRTAPGTGGSPTATTAVTATGTGRR